MEQGEVVRMNWVLAPGGTEYIGIEIHDSEGGVYYIGKPNTIHQGMHVGKFPCGADGQELEREEAIRLAA